MTSEWTITKLSNVAKIVGGGTPSTVIASYWDGVIPWITPKDLSGYKDMYISNGSRTISDLGLKESSTKLVPKGTVLFTSRAPIGYVAIASQPVCTNQGFKSLILNEGYDNRFFYYLLKHHTYEIEAKATGSTFKEISGTTLGEFEVKIPHQKIQKNISNFLSTIDDRIRLLRETNLSLEVIIQTLFKSWFVNFDPVRAKQQGRQPEGMDGLTAALFPDRFEQSELGEIPKSWKIQSLADIANYLNGLALQKFPPKGKDDLPVIKIAQLRKGNVQKADMASNVIQEKYIVKNGDVLFSWSGSLEVEIWGGGIGALNQHLFKVSSDYFQKWFYYLWTKHHLEKFRRIAASKATTMGHIQRKHLIEAKVIIPSEDIVNLANQIFTPLLNKIISNSVQVCNLSNIRDVLLPRVISGKLELPEAESKINNKTKVIT